ncbi:hypothetical protein DXG03_008031 [Asterophora parasitica]|uniref:Major facilitator superfamily (MFS) profile domain-containing protein n=1 Tax=Asterophora parasitica TaxID=117018 RepID=A0A9P7G6A1_9AGAR|nr:hypothetical protein DXG03_008031 [Asterophora parasitica]
MTGSEQNAVNVVAGTAQEESIDHDIHEPPKTHRTPLPKVQLFIVFMVQLAEPITGTVVYPFVNQFVRDTGITRGDERKTGYYAGIIESSFFFAEAFTVFHWGRLSDKLGRRPVILLGPLGLTIATLSFGLSNNFWTLVVSRWMQGAFNGNIGVTKSVIGEITDSTNVGDAFAIIPLMWSSGCTVGPIMGGLLSQPATTWPGLFGRIPFFHHYPYFLPCAVAALLASFTGLIAFIGLKETLPSALKKQKQQPAASATPDSTTSLLLASEDLSYGSSTSPSTTETGVTQEELHAPPAFKDLLIPEILLKLLVYAFVSFVDMSCQVLQPLVYSTSIANGGLGFDPYRIGTIMGTFGVINALAQLLFLGRVIRKFGPTNVQKFAQFSFLTVLSLYPLLSFFAKRAGGADNVDDILV